MMEHTKEPWHYVKDEQCSESFTVKYGEWYVATTYGSADVENSEEANARRIVACVNACAGIPTESLEDMVTPIRIHLNHADLHAKRMVEQRDQLLAALEEATNPNGGACRPEKFATLIASVKGGAA